MEIIESVIKENGHLGISPSATVSASCDGETISIEAFMGVEKCEQSGKTIDIRPEAWMSIVDGKLVLRMSARDGIDFEFVFDPESGEWVPQGGSR